MLSYGHISQVAFWEKNELMIITVALGQNALIKELTLII
jgi:hypothetical protein